jgi:SNF2 family DNA or RNA helicase
MGLKLFVYYGSAQKDVAVPSDTEKSRRSYDVVITSYGVVVSEARRLGLLSGNQADAKRGGFILGAKWGRIVLDEAHVIRNMRTDVSRACSLLSAECRWALSGTPIQNSIGDLFAILHFLRHEPWSEWNWWKRIILDPMAVISGGSDKRKDDYVIPLVKDMLQPIMLRRLKSSLDENGVAIVVLPPKQIHIVLLDMNEYERAFYDALLRQSKDIVEGIGAVVVSTQGPSGSNDASNNGRGFMALFTVLMRLRQACNHPLLALGESFLQRVQNPVKSERNQVNMLSYFGRTSSFSIPASSSVQPYIVEDLTNDCGPNNDIRSIHQTISESPLINECGDDEGNGALFTDEFLKFLYKRYISATSGSIVNTATLSSCTLIDPLSDPDFPASIIGEKCIADSSNAVCLVCSELCEDDGVLTPCKHLFCVACAESVIPQLKYNCPFCMTAIAKSDLIRASSAGWTSNRKDLMLPPEESDTIAAPQTSSKVSVLLDIIKKELQSTKSSGQNDLLCSDRAGVGRRSTKVCFS